MYDLAKIKAHGAYVLVRRLKPPGETASGLALPDQRADKNLNCEVLSVGHGEYVNGTHIHSNLKPGDIVLIRQFEGRRLNFDKNVLLVHHDLIDGRYTEEDKDGGQQCA